MDTIDFVMIQVAGFFVEETKSQSYGNEDSNLFILEEANKIYQVQESISSLSPFSPKFLGKNSSSRDPSSFNGKFSKNGRFQSICSAW